MTLLQDLKAMLIEMLTTTKYAMSYNQVRFLIFLIVFLCIYFLIRHNAAKKIWILIGNIFFYIWSGWAGLVIVLGTAIVVYFVSLKMERIYDVFEKEKAGLDLKPKEQVAYLAKYKKESRKYLWIAMFLILGIWIYVKAGKLAGMPSVVSFGEWFSGMGIIVPLGISYYTLSALGYLLDIFWRKAKPVHNFLDLLVAMTYFPHIVQGPISKYDKLLKQFADIPKFNYDRVCFGLQLMLWGYIKKVVIADRLIVYTQAVFGNLAGFGGGQILLAVLLSGVQLYADFSGCMDIVRGISHAMGIELEANFRQPFFARSASEFWTRWHMTLSAWTKAYIYLPIAMNPKFMKQVRKIKKNNGARLSSFVNSFVPLIAVWLFTGLWHGTGVDYIIWGLYWCAMMTISKETSFIWDKLCRILHIDLTKDHHKYWQCFRTYMIFVVGKCFTAAGGLAGFAAIWKGIFINGRWGTLFDGSLFTYGLDKPDFIIAVIGMLLMLVIDILHEKGTKLRETIAKIPLPLRWCIYLGAIIIIVVFGVYGPGFDAKSFAYGAY